MKKSKSLFLVTVLVYIFLIGPLLVIMAASFSDTTYLKFPGEGFTLKWYAQILKVNLRKRSKIQYHYCICRYLPCSDSGTSCGLCFEPLPL